MAGDRSPLGANRLTPSIECSGEPLCFAADLLRDVAARTGTAMRSAHALRVCELALAA